LVSCALGGRPLKAAELIAHDARDAIRRCLLHVCWIGRGNTARAASVLRGMTMTILALSAVAAALPGLLIWILDAVKR
jgi:hypothetical protein